VGFWKGEIWNRRKNGETYPQGVNIASVTDDHGQIVQYVGVFQDITDMKERQKDMSYYAHHDPLTGLPNRLLFDDRLRHAINRARRDNKKAAVIYIDLDGFKEINDTHGHSVGDMVLQGVAVRLSSSLRVEDTISRFGGDEFIILLEHTGHKRGLKIVAEKILAAVQEPFLLNGLEISVGASIGVVMFPIEVQDPETLITSADTAMYAAKQEGKNRVVFYGDLKKKQDKAAGASAGD
ncbi:MAG: sensor domain-containing diguanylate cyclase, partial [Nitrospinae bacterium]|nr:sensor domain-containing diguanylate cyclase [Nitrospinota bacterium]